MLPWQEPQCLPNSGSGSTSVESALCVTVDLDCGSEEIARKQPSTAVSWLTVLGCERGHAPPGRTAVPVRPGDRGGVGRRTL